MAEASVKILAMDGSLVREFRAQGGGRAYWDGRDLHGAYVSSGPYYIVAYAENGNALTTGKIVVIRK
jgi:flagellar hook assembly protein FlgD